MTNVRDNNSHSGGVKIPQAVRDRTQNRILTYAKKQYSGKYTRIDVRFQGQLCYIDAYLEPYVPYAFDPSVAGESREEYIERRRNTPLHLCRLRYLGDEDHWSVALYTYRHEKYEPCVFDNGCFLSTPEDAFETSAIYFQD